MKPSEARDLLNPEEFDRWFARLMRRKMIGNYIIIWLCVIVALVAIPYFTITLMTTFYGPESWASGVFLSGLFLWVLYSLNRYWDQGLERPDDE